MHSLFSTVTSFGLLAVVVIGTFVYVSTQSGYIGIYWTEVTAEIAQQMHLGKAQGFLVEAVDSKGPADRAGIKGGTTQVVIGDRQVIIGGDVVVAVDGHPINNKNDLTASLKDKQIGDNISFTVLRDNTTRDIQVKVAKNPIAPFP